MRAMAFTSSLHDVPAPVRVLAISGSLQPASANAAALRATERSGPPTTTWARWAAIADVPAYRTDLDVEEAPPAVASLRAALAAADAVCIATPEYAHSFPGALKNALDWLVSSGSLYLKPVMLVSAGSSGGGRALGALAQTLHAQGAVLVDTVPIPGVRTKLGANGELADGVVLARLGEAVRRLGAAVATPADPEAGPLAAAVPIGIAIGLVAALAVPLLTRVRRRA
jgi:NAD(P)H-dependent FMN reductase